MYYFTPDLILKELTSQLLDNLHVGSAIAQLNDYQYSLHQALESFQSLYAY